MSLFGSLYDEEAGDDASPPPGAEPAAASAGEPGSPDAASPDAGLPEIDMPADDPVGDPTDEAPTPATDLEIDAPSMSLQDFAAQMFDGSTENDATDEGGPSDQPISIEVADDLDADFAALSTGEPTPDAGADTQPDPEIEVPEPDEPVAAEAATDERSDASSDDASGEAPSGFSSLFGGDDEVAPDSFGPSDGPGADVAPKSPQPAGSLASAASDLADLAKSPVATLAPPDEDDETDFEDDAPPPGPEESGTAEAADGPVDFGEPLLVDDLLPSAKPAGGSSLPSLSGRIPVKLVAVLVVAALAGFVGMRMLGGGSGSDAAAEPGSAEAAAPPDDPGSEIPRSPGEVLDRAQTVGAEAELRDATIAAQAEYANSGTFARSAADWDAVIAQARVADGASTAPARDVLSVVSDDDAVCFETLLQNGTTAAAGVTATAIGFEQDPGGGSICTADAAVIEGWAPSLSGV